MSEKLWQHQQSGVEFDAARPASFFAWGMGSGKTLAAIIAALEQRAVLVVCPISVGPAWARHFAEHDPSRVVANAFSGTATQRKRRLDHALAAARSGHRVAIIVNYDSVWRAGMAKSIEAFALDRIILDESHRAKAPGGRASKYLFGLAKKFPNAKRLCLSGTPCPHSPLDLYAQYRFLAPEVLGTSYSLFRARYSIPHPKFPGAVLAYKNQEELAERVAPYQHTVDTDAVLTLPDSVHTRIDVPLSPAETDFYVQMAANLVARIAAGEVAATNVLTQLLRLQQACSGHTVVGEPGDEKETVILNGCGERTSKGAALTDWMTDVPAGEPIVVFCRFREDLRQARLAAESNGRQCMELSGSGNDLELWQKSNGGEVIAVQLQSGGVGIDLTRARFCAFMSLGFSLGDYEQALARIRRPGQTRTCKYFHFVAQADGVKSSLDELVYCALHDRKEVVDLVLDKIRELDTLVSKGVFHNGNGRQHAGLDELAAGKRKRQSAH